MKYWAILLILGSLSLGGCFVGPDVEGRAHASKADVVGSYKLRLDDGVERLELKADGTYVRDTLVHSKHVLSNGVWTIDSWNFGNTDVQIKTTDREINLQVYKRHGQIELARNAIADWYYERVQ